MSAHALTSLFRRGWAALALLALLAPGPVPAAGPREVRVGGYEFAPFVEVAAQGHPSGLTLDLIDLLNKSQDQYRFRFVLSSPSRRYQDFQAGKYDVIFFESPEWGWRQRDIAIEATEPFLEGGEVYIALAGPGRGQAYFDDLTGKKMVGVRGYHYGFAGFNADPDFLRERFDMTLVYRNAASITLILEGRGDIAVVTQSYLKQYLHEHPEDRGKLLVSDKLDQAYHHRALVRRGFRPDAAWLNRLLEDLAKNGSLGRLFRSHGLER